MLAALETEQIPLQSNICFTAKRADRNTDANWKHKPHRLQIYSLSVSTNIKHLFETLCHVYQKGWDKCVACRPLEHSCSCWQLQLFIFGAVIRKFTCNNHHQRACTDVFSTPGGTEETDELWETRKCEEKRMCWIF